MIRLATYNIRAGLGIDNRRSMQRVADVIRGIGPQIVCLQEVDQRMPRGRMEDQPKCLSKALDMQVCFQRNLSIGVGGFGNALLTSLPITETKSHHLTSVGEQRGALEVRLLTPDGPLTVFCTHLGLNADERVVQARELAAWANACDGPRLVCGDFNEEATGQAVTELISSTGLIDATAGGPATFSSDSPQHRIDLILTTPSITVSNACVIDTQASDHLPVVADLRLPVDRNGSGLMSKM